MGPEKRGQVQPRGGNIEHGKGRSQGKPELAGPVDSVETRAVRAPFKGSNSSSPLATAFQLTPIAPA